MKWRWIGVAFVLAGCVRGPAPQTEAEALQKFDEDRQIVAKAVPPDYKRVIVEALRRELKDPYSVRDPEITDPAPGFIGILNGGQGVVVCVRLNAKNSFGAYTGRTTWGFAFREGMIVAQWPEGNSLACQGRAYFPFPELSADLKAAR
jgi:hypothetical protein